MERQLKERLIGAAVLVAVAVVMVPEMFSGPHSHSEPSADASSASSGQIKTYHIELQSAHSAEAAAPVAVEAPAAQPRDEAPSGPATSNVVSTSSNSVSSVSSSTASASSSTSRPDTGPAPAATKPAAKPASTPEQVPNKAVLVAKPAEGDWTVQVGSFATQDKAHQIVGKLKEQGYPAYLGKVTVGGKTLYRVRVGATPTRAAAESTLQKLKATYPGASVVPANR